MLASQATNGSYSLPPNQEDPPIERRIEGNNPKHETSNTDSIELISLESRSHQDARNRRGSEDSSREADDQSTVTSQEERDVGASVRLRRPSIQHDRVFYRRPFVTMVILFVLGVTLAISHHVFYWTLDEQIVGDANTQRWVLRGGNVFALFVHTTLAASVSIAYSQRMWKTLKDTKITIGTLDVAFAADKDLILLLSNFFNTEMYREMTLDLFMILIFWCIPIASLFTPATLSVQPGLNYNSTSANVTFLDMTTVNYPLNIDQPARFAFSVPLLGWNNSNNASQVFIGPRTVMSHIALAVASAGSILQISSPYQNSTYNLTFVGPRVVCDAASSSVQTAIDNLVNRETAINQTLSDGTVVEIENHFFAFVPDLSSYGNGSYIPQGANISAIFDNRPQQPANASNQLWMRYSTYANGSNCTNPIEIDYTYTVCTLWESIYDVQISFVNGSQIIADHGHTLLNQIPYPVIDPNTTSNLTQQAYSALMWAMSDQILGSMGLYNQTSISSQNSTTADNSVAFTTSFDEINTGIQYTYLIGSSSLDVFFDRYHIIRYGSSSCPPTDQRALDISLARNLPLTTLIEELSFNTTMSLFSSNLLSPYQMRPVNTTEVVNRYNYAQLYLLLSYGLAVFFSLLANIVGALAFRYNGVSHDRSASAIISSIIGGNLSARQEQALIELFRKNEASLGRLPLPPGIKSALVKCVGIGEEWGLGLKLV